MPQDALASSRADPAGQKPQTEPLSIRAGHIVALRLIDVAYAIDLKTADELWGERRQRQSARSQLSATPQKAMSFGVPPLMLTLDPVELPGIGTLEASVRLYDFGVAAFALRHSVEDVSPAAFTALAGTIDAALGPDTALPNLATIWAELLAQLHAALGEALQRPTGNASAAALEEDYLIAIVHKFDRKLQADDLLASFDITPLLSGESRPLSAGARADLLRNRFSYYEDDLVVLGWDRAFIYEPRGDSDVADVLEVANAQLLEMRYYDELLDAELPRMYNLVEAARSTTSLLAARRYAKLARRLYALVAEVTELTERVDNALQVTEDVYLARVYGAAMDLFRVPNVSAAVDRKLAIIRDTYAALHSEASSGRAELLEIGILVLIIAEVVLSLLRH